MGMSLPYLVQFVQLPGVTAVSALSDRALLFGGAMIVTALVTLLVWDNLAVEPRDSLILGHLPIPDQDHRARQAGGAVQVRRHLRDGGEPGAEPGLSDVPDRQPAAWPSPSAVADHRARDYRPAGGGVRLPERVRRARALPPAVRTAVVWPDLGHDSQHADDAGDDCPSAAAALGGERGDERDCRPAALPTTRRRCGLSASTRSQPATSSSMLSSSCRRSARRCRGWRRIYDTDARGPRSTIAACSRRSARLARSRSSCFRSSPWSRSARTTGRIGGCRFR